MWVGAIMWCLTYKWEHLYVTTQRHESEAACIRELAMEYLNKWLYREINGFEHLGKTVWVAPKNWQKAVESQDWSDIAEPMPDSEDEAEKHKLVELVEAHEDWTKEQLWLLIGDFNYTILFVVQEI